jgi:hypothetical protein
MRNSDVEGGTPTLDVLGHLDSYDARRLLDAKALPLVSGGYVLVEGVRAALALYRG